MNTLSFRIFVLVVAGVVGVGAWDAWAQSDGACTANGQGVDTGSVDSINLPTVKAKIQEYKAAQKECVSQSQQAQMTCIAACSGENSAGKNAQGACANAVVGGASNVNSGLQVKCNQQQADTMNNIMNQCNPPKAGCSATCPKAKQKLQEAQSAVSQDPECKKNPPNPECQSAPGKIAGQIGKESSGPQSTEGRKQECDGKLSDNMKDLMKALSELMKQIPQNQSNGDQQAAAATTSTDPCVTDPTGATCICKDPAQARNPLCTKATAGDPGVYSSTLPTTNVSSAPDSGGNAGTTTAPNFGSSAADATARAPGGDGGGFAGAGAGHSKDKDAKDGDVKEKGGLTASILNGDGGGGSGMGGSSLGGGGDSEEAKGKKGKGGKSVAALAAAANMGFTRAGGRSNWEKVKTRYADNTPTFLKDDKVFYASPTASSTSPSTPSPAKPSTTTATASAAPGPFATKPPIAPRAPAAATGK